MSRSNHKSKAKSKKATACANATSTTAATADADIQKMFHWASNSSGTIHPSIQIKKRASGGYGLFTKTSLSENTKIVRLMQASTYSILTLHVMKQFVLDKAVYKADWARTRAIFDACVGDADDSEISDGSAVVYIRNYMWAFYVGLAMVKSKREAPISELETYIKVLLQTPILDVDTSFCSEDTLINTLIKDKELVRGHYEKLVKMKPEVKAVMSFETAFQLHQAISCKMMTIPESTSPDVNSALIPFIDIAQHHSTKYNAEFASVPLDHDPSKRFIALFLIRNVKAGQEIYIYNTTNEVCRSMEIRGYIPQEPRTLSWTIPGWRSVFAKVIEEANVEASMKTEVNIEMMALWLKVKPEIPLEQERAGYVVLDEARFKLPLLLIPGLKYHRKGALRFFPGTTDAEFDATDDVQLYKKIEAEAGATAYGVLFENTPVQLHDILKQTGTDSKSKIDDLAKRTTELLFSLGSRPRARENFCSMKLQSTYNGVLEQYEAEKEVMLSRFFATPYDEMLRMVQRSIQNYQLEEEM